MAIKRESGVKCGAFPQGSVVMVSTRKKSSMFGPMFRIYACFQSELLNALEQIASQHGALVDCVVRDTVKTAPVTVNNYWLLGCGVRYGQ